MHHELCCPFLCLARTTTWVCRWGIRRKGDRNDVEQDWVPVSVSSGWRGGLGREGRGVFLTCGVEGRENARMRIAGKGLAGSVTWRIHTCGKDVGADVPVLGPREGGQQRPRGRRSREKAGSVTGRMYARRVMVHTSTGPWSRS
jgi:hypothetical protein